MLARVLQQRGLLQPRTDAAWRGLLPPLDGGQGVVGAGRQGVEIDQFAQQDRAGVSRALDERVQNIRGLGELPAVTQQLHAGTHEGFGLGGLGFGGGGEQGLGRGAVEGLFVQAGQQPGFAVAARCGGGQGFDEIGFGFGRPCHAGGGGRGTAHRLDVG